MYQYALVQIFHLSFVSFLHYFEFLTFQARYLAQMENDSFSERHCKFWLKLMNIIEINAQLLVTSSFLYFWYMKTEFLPTNHVLQSLLIRLQIDQLLIEKPNLLYQWPTEDDKDNKPSIFTTFVRHLENQMNSQSTKTR